MKVFLLKRPFRDCSVVDRRAFNFILCALLLSLFWQTYHTYFSNTFNIFLSLIILYLGFCGWIVYTSIHKVATIIRYFFFLIFYFLVVGLSYGGPFTNNIIGLMLSQDIRYVLLFILGGCFATVNNMKYFHQIMKIIAMLAVISGFFALFYFNFSMAVIAERSGGWTISYYYWWVSGACYCYMGYYALFMKKDKWLGYGCLVAYGLIGALFLKREVVINIGFMVIFYMLFSKNKVRNFLILLFGIVSLGLLLFVVFGSYTAEVYELMMGRFEMVDEQKDGRLNEIEVYLQTAPTMMLIFGNGIGHYLDSYVFRDEDGLLNAMHMGFANLLYKGGLVYVFYIIVLYFPILGKLFHLPTNNYDRACLGVALSYFVSLSFGGGWTYSLDPFCISAPIFYIATRPTIIDRKTC